MKDNFIPTRELEFKLIMNEDGELCAVQRDTGFSTTQIFAVKEKFNEFINDQWEEYVWHTPEEEQDEEAKQKHKFLVDNFRIESWY